MRNYRIYLFVSLLFVMICYPLVKGTAAQELRVNLPEGTYEFWLEWTFRGQQQGSHPITTSGAELIVDLSPIPPKAEDQKLWVLDKDADLLASALIEEKTTLDLKAEDFNMLPQFKVIAQIADEETLVTAYVSLKEEDGSLREEKTEIEKGQGKIIFPKIKMGKVTIEVDAPGYQKYEQSLSLTASSPRELLVGLSKPSAAPLEERRPFSALQEWRRVITILVILSTAFLLVLGGFSLLEGRHPLQSPPWRRVAAISALPFVALAGCVVVSELAAVRDVPAGANGIGWAMVGWLFLAASVVSGSLGRRFLAGSTLAGTAACVSATAGALGPNLGNISLLALIFGALGTVSGLIGALIWTLPRISLPKVAEAPAPAPEVAPGVCPYCGQQKDPVTGECACSPAPAEEVTEPSLVAQAGPLAGQVFPLKEHLAIGRAPDNDIVIEDMTVSRQHCTLGWDGTVATLKDEGSANGTFVNGERIDEKQLNSQDIIQIGGSSFKLEI